MQILGNKLLATFGFLLIAYLPAMGQNHNAYYFKKYDHQQGLSLNDNLFMYLDSRGLMWMGTTEGLNTFDGQRNKLHLANKNDTLSLFDNIIQSNVFEDKKGDMWFCTYEAIHCYRRNADRFERFWLLNGRDTIKNNYYVFALDEDGYLWLRLGGWDANPVLYKFNTLQAANGTAPIQKVSEFNGYRSAWVSGKNKGVAIIVSYPTKNGFGFTSYKIVPSKPVKTMDYLNYGATKHKIKHILMDSDAMWVASDLGLMKIKKTNFNSVQSFNTFQNKDIGTVKYLTQWRDSIIIALTDKQGLLFFDKKRGVFTTSIDINKDTKDKLGLCADNFYMMYADNKDNLWLSSITEKCVSQINLKKIKFDIFKSFPKENDKKLEVIHFYLYLSLGICSLSLYSNKQTQYSFKTKK